MKPSTICEGRIVSHCGTRSGCPRHPPLGGEKHNRTWLAEIGLERSELLPHRMVALTERNQVLKPVRAFVVEGAVGIDECAKRRNVVDVQVTVPALAMSLAVDRSPWHLALEAVPFQSTLALSVPVRSVRNVSVAALPERMLWAAWTSGILEPGRFDGVLPGPIPAGRGSNGVATRVAHLDS